MSAILDDPQYQPPKIYAEGTWLYGAIVTAILYGVVVVLYTMCARSLWGRIRSRDGATKKNWFFFVYVNFIFALSTIYVASNSQITQFGFINHRDYPGGPSAYELNTPSVPLNVSFAVSNWCADALMIWRCIVVYRDSKFHFVVTVLGCFMLLASIVTGTLWLSVVSQSERPATGWMSFSFLFPYLSVSLAINILICILTVVRLLYHRACIARVLGPEYGRLYASFAAIIVESAAVYSTCSLLYLVPYAVDSPLADAFTQILGEAQVIAPLLIIYRVSEGKAWSKDTTSRLAPSSSQLVRRMTAQHGAPYDSQSMKRLTAQVALESMLRADGEGSVQFPDEEDKGSVTTPNPSPTCATFPNRGN